MTLDKDVKIMHQPGPAIRALIVDRDPMSSDLLAAALSRERRCEASAIPSSELLRRLATGKVDVVVIGMDLDTKAEGSSLDLSMAVCNAHPNVNIIMLLNGTTHEAVISAFRYGARGVFSRHRPISEFLDCVDHVGKGFIWAGRQETSALLEAFKSIPAPNLLFTRQLPNLTARELEVVQYAAKGKTNKNIASHLRLSEHTVKNYLFRAFEKLGVSSRIELLFYLTTQGHTFSGMEPGYMKTAGSDELPSATLP